MIDTICLLLPTRVIVNQEERMDLISRQTKLILKPLQTVENSRLYFPKVTLYSKGFYKEPVIKVEFSAPKLLFKNNIEELDNENFEAVTRALQDRLYRLGLVIDMESLANASVSFVHYSKNIRLQDGYTSNHLISQLSKINLIKNFDIARVKYTNAGQSLHAHNSSHELVIYDKISEMHKTKGRVLDKDYHDLQKEHLLQLMQGEQIEILRIEIRLCKRKKLVSMLHMFGGNRDPTFKNIFDSQLSKRIVNHYWNVIINAKNSGLFTLEKTPKELLRQMLQKNPKLKAKQAIFLLGLITASKDGDGMRELRQIVTPRIQERGWHRLNKELEKIVATNIAGKNRSWVNQLDASLAEFSPIRFDRSDIV